MNYNEARSRIREFSQESEKAFGPGIKVSEFLPTGDIPCSDSSDPSANTTVAVGTSYLVDGVSDFAQSQKEFVQYWTGRGWHLKGGKISGGQAIVISRDDFALNYAARPQPHQGVISGSSPCVPKSTVSAPA